MSEINARWARDQWQAKKAAMFFAVLAAPLWTASYQLTFPIFTMPQWQWFTAISIITGLGAVGTTIGSACSAGFFLLNEKPLPGSNY
jgi:hypothetical protein